MNPTATISSKSTNRIGIVVPYAFIPPTSGGKRVCFSLATSLSKQVPTFVCSTKRQGGNPGIAVDAILPSSAFRYLNPISIFRLNRWIKNRRLNFCILNHIYFFLPTYLACRLNRVPLVVYSHNLEHRRADPKVGRIRALVFQFERMAYRLSDAVFFISQPELNVAIDIFGLEESRCYFVPHIAQPRIQHPRSQARPNRPFSIIFFGNFDFDPNRQGLRILLEKIVPLMEKELDFEWKLTIFGNALSKSNSVQNGPTSIIRSVEFLGFITNISDILDRADLLLNPIYTGAGAQTKIIEALSSDITVVSADSGAHGIDKKACGNKLITVPDHNWGAYVEAIVEIHQQGLHLMPLPTSFLSVYGEKTIIGTVLRALEELQLK